MIALLARKVDGLRREIPSAVRQIPAPRRRRPLVSDYRLGRAQHAIVTFSRLQYDFHAFQGRADRLREAAAAAAQYEVFRELRGADARLRDGHFSLLLSAPVAGGECFCGAVARVDGVLVLLPVLGCWLF